MDEKDFIEHYGVPGMKWGVRRFKRYSEIGKRNKAQKKMIADKLKTSVKRSKTKPLSAKRMSDDELRKRINRLQMERQYANLTSQEKSRGHKLTNTLMSKVGHKVADRVIDRTLIDPIDDFFKGIK